MKDGTSFIPPAFIGFLPGQTDQGAAGDPEQLQQRLPLLFVAGEAQGENTGERRQQRADLADAKIGDDRPWRGLGQGQDFR